MRTVVLTCLFASVVVGQPDEALKKEEELLKGVWKLTVGEEDGMRTVGSDNTLLYSWRWVFTATNVRKLGAEFERERGISTYTLDPTANPKTIDVKLGIGFRGIYRVEKDKLMFCFSLDPESKMRPNDFTAKKGSKRFLFIFEKEKP